MSELRDLLTPSQLTKHYEILQFLSAHTNEVFRVAQLDYRLPHGSSLLRFPEEWFSSVERGLLGHRSIELIHHEEEANEGDGDDGGSTDAVMLARARIGLVCRRPEIHSVEELRGLLQSPSTMLDAEGCVGLHTDQVLIHPDLLKSVQRRGVANYFPDRQMKRYTVAADEDQHYSLAGMKTLVLPTGLRLRYRHISLRGISSSGEGQLLRCVEVGERVFMTIDRRPTDTPTETASTTSPLEVSCTCNAIKLRVPPTTSGTGEVQLQPLRMRMKRSSAGTTERVLVEMEAVQAAFFKLMISIQGVENVIDMEVADREEVLPGVLIASERLPSSVGLPPEYCLHDAMVCPTGDVLEEAGGKREREGEEEEEQAPCAPSPLESVADWLPLPWWQSRSPHVLSIRDRCLPSDAAITEACAKVFSSSSLMHEEALRTARLRLQQEWSRDRGRPKRRFQYRSNVDLRNRHMLHYGLDASVPFLADGAAPK